MILSAYDECVLFLSDVLKAFSHEAHDYMLLHHVLDFLYERAKQTAGFFFIINQATMAFWFCLSPNVMMNYEFIMILKRIVILKRLSSLIG